jgi:RNA polymerase sigma factor (sigma-70 family)
MGEADSVRGEEYLSTLSPDPEAFVAFYRQFEGPVLTFFKHATHRAELAADLTAETFAVALENVRLYRSDLGRPDQWLFGIARNVLSRSYRSRRVDASARVRLGLPKLVLDDETLATIERLDREVGRATLALAGLPEDQRYAVQARVVDELPYPEIARVLCCSEAVVRKRVSRGLRSLRRSLESGR